MGGPHSILPYIRRSLTLFALIGGFPYTVKERAQVDGKDERSPGSHFSIQRSRCLTIASGILVTLNCLSIISTMASLFDHSSYVMLSTMTHSTAMVVCRLIMVTSCTVLLVHLVSRKEDLAEFVIRLQNFVSTREIMLEEETEDLLHKYIIVTRFLLVMVFGISLYWVISFVFILCFPHPRESMGSTLLVSTAIVQTILSSLGSVAVILLFYFTVVIIALVYKSFFPSIRQCSAEQVLTTDETRENSVCQSSSSVVNASLLKGQAELCSSSVSKLIDGQIRETDTRDTLTEKVRVVGPFTTLACGETGYYTTGEPVMKTNFSILWSAGVPDSLLQNEVREAMEGLYSVYQLHREVNLYFSVPLLSVLLFSMTTTLLNSFALFSREIDVLVFQAHCVSQSILEVTKLSFVCSITSAVTDKRNDLRNVVVGLRLRLRLSTSDPSCRLQEEMTRLLALLDEYPDFSLCGFIVVDRARLLQIASFILTHLMILLQFRIGEKSSFSRDASLTQEVEE